MDPNFLRDIEAMSRWTPPPRASRPAPAPAPASPPARSPWLWNQPGAPLPDPLPPAPRLYPRHRLNIPIVYDDVVFHETRTLVPGDIVWVVEQDSRKFHWIPYPTSPQIFESRTYHLARNPEPEEEPEPETSSQAPPSTSAPEPAPLPDLESPEAITLLESLYTALSDALTNPNSTGYDQRLEIVKQMRRVKKAIRKLEAFQAQAQSQSQANTPPQPGPSNAGAPPCPEISGTGTSSRPGPSSSRAPPRPEASTSGNRPRPEPSTSSSRPKRPASNLASQQRNRMTEERPYWYDLNAPFDERLGEGYIMRDLRASPTRTEHLYTTPRPAPELNEFSGSAAGNSEGSERVDNTGLLPPELDESSEFAGGSAGGSGSGGIVSNNNTNIIPYATADGPSSTTTVEHLPGASYPRMENTNTSAVAASSPTPLNTFTPLNTPINAHAHVPQPQPPPGLNAPSDGRRFDAELRRIIRAYRSGTLESSSAYLFEDMDDFHNRYASSSGRTRGVVSHNTNATVRSSVDDAAAVAYPTDDGISSTTVVEHVPAGAAYPHMDSINTNTRTVAAPLTAQTNTFTPINAPTPEADLSAFVEALLPIRPAPQSPPLDPRPQPHNPPQPPNPPPTTPIPRPSPSPSPSSKEEDQQLLTDLSTMVATLSPTNPYEALQVLQSVHARRAAEAEARRVSEAAEEAERRRMEEVVASMRAYAERLRREGERLGVEGWGVWEWEGEWEVIGWEEVEGAAQATQATPSPLSEEEQQGAEIVESTPPRQLLRSESQSRRRQWRRGLRSLYQARATGYGSGEGGGSSR